MFTELKSLCLKKSLKFIVIYAVLVIALGIYCAPSINSLIQGPKNLYDLPVDTVKDQYVTADIKYLYDNFSSLYTKSNYSSEKISKSYYILPLDGKLIALEVKAKDIKAADKVLNDSFDYMSGTRDNLTNIFHVTGTVTKMKGAELTGFYNEWLSGILENPTAEQIGKISFPYMLRPNYIGNIDSTLLYLLCAVIIFSFIAFFYLLITRLSGLSLSSIRKFIKNSSSPMTEEYMNADFAGAEVVGDMRIGKLFTFYFFGTKPNVLDNNQIIWSHLETTTHKTNGIKTRVEKAIAMYTRDKKKRTVHLDSEDDVIKILEIYKERQPHMVIGYSDELKNLYTRNFDAFLNLPFVREAASTEETDLTNVDIDNNENQA